VDFHSAIHPSKGYQVSTPVFSGPLDLLLHLIERAELDITRLSLAKVTDQYLEHLRLMQERHADEVSGFLVIAARLLQIKSEALLPRPPAREPGEEDPGEALVRQLLIYKRFKEMANFLAEREASGRRTYLHLAAAPRLNVLLDPGEVSLADLFGAARAIFVKVDERLPLGDVVTPPRITIREKIHQIAADLRRQGQVQFSQLFSGRPSPIEVIVTFLALLELIKRRLVQARQESLFGEIYIENAGLSAETEIFELEFGE
jgi:segregation and condensation protein A